MVRHCHAVTSFHTLTSTHPSHPHTVTIGHETVMAKATFFSTSESIPNDLTFDLSKDYSYAEALLESGPIHTHYGNHGNGDDVKAKLPNQFALLEFEKPVTCPVDSIVIGSRLDMDAFSNMCRIALHGSVVRPITERDYETSFLPSLKVYKMKSKEGVVDRVSKQEVGVAIMHRVRYTDAG